jgi:hypothetical protein
MSLSIDGVWKSGVWDETVWADGVWREGEPAIIIGYMIGMLSVKIATSGDTTVKNATTGDI